MKFPLFSEEDNFQVTSLLSFEPILECGPLDPSRYPQLSHLFGPPKGFEPQGDKPGHCLKPNEVGSSHPQITLREVLSSTEHQQGSRKPGPLDWKSFSVLSSQEKFSPSTFHPFFLPLEIRSFTTPFCLPISPLSLLQTLPQSNHLHISYNGCSCICPQGGLPRWPDLSKGCPSYCSKQHQGSRGQWTCLLW